MHAYRRQTASQLQAEAFSLPQELRGVLSAREFVEWYNGHPDAGELPVDLSSIQTVAICGLGNVAVDCARILLQPHARLESTDIAEHALAQLRTSAVRRVHLVGRRGIVQAKWLCICTCPRLVQLASKSNWFSFSRRNGARQASNFSLHPSAKLSGAPKSPVHLVSKAPPAYLRSWSQKRR